MSQVASSAIDVQQEPLPEGVKLKLPDGSYILADGTHVKEKPAPQQPAISVVREIQNGRAAAKTLEKIHRKLGDLPEGDTKQLNAIAAILTYTQVGLSDDDIAVALGAHVSTITGIKELDAYRELSSMFDANVFDDAKRTASHILARASGHAANTMVNALDSPNEQIAVVAAKEVLARNGISAETNTHEKKTGLNIRIVRKGERRDDTITVEM